jgi:hypothetical protein
MHLTNKELNKEQPDNRIMYWLLPTAGKQHERGLVWWPFEHVLTVVAADMDVALPDCTFFLAMLDDWELPRTYLWSIGEISCHFASLRVGDFRAVVEFQQRSVHSAIASL